MLEMRPGRPEEVPAQKALWKAAFGDEDRYIDWFYECCGASADVLEVVEEGRLASMLALLPQTLTLPGGGTASGWYIYALATDPGARSKGYGRQLLRFVDGYLAERGADCVTTVPAEPSLFKFFGTVGFAPCFSTRKLELLKSMLQPAAEGDRAEPVEPGEYNAIRRRIIFRFIQLFILNIKDIASIDFFHAERVISVNQVAFALFLEYAFMNNRHNIFVVKQEKRG